MPVLRLIPQLASIVTHYNFDSSSIFPYGVVVTMPEQEIKSIPLSKLRLWTENPRDPMDESMSDSEIIKRAIVNDSDNWNLDSLIVEMGKRYHLNEIPVVVANADDTFTVYDGNRRVALLKCIKDPDLFQDAFNRLGVFEVEPELRNLTVLPCNVRTKEIALEIVERIHRSSNKWGKLQYEQFLHNFRGQPKGPLMLLDEATGGIVATNKKLNEEYVEKRLLTESNLNKIGFSIKKNELVTNFTPEEAVEILKDFARIRNADLSSARKNPGKLKEALIELDPDKYANVPSFNENKPITRLGENTSNGRREMPSAGVLSHNSARRKPVKNKEETLFGGILRPKGSRSNELYRAIDDIYHYYLKNEQRRSHFLPIVAFSMRLLLEICAQEYFKANNPDKDCKDGALKPFLKAAKKKMQETAHFQEVNEITLNSEWIDGRLNFEGILSKWAHGTLRADNESIVRISGLVGNIIRLMWSD